MARLLLVLLIGLAALPALAADEAPPPPKEMVLLTVSGLIGNTNRDALDPRKDSLLAAQKAAFGKAFAFDRPSLLALEQGSVTAQPPELDALIPYILDSTPTKPLGLVPRLNPEVYVFCGQLFGREQRAVPYEVAQMRLDHLLPNI